MKQTNVNAEVLKFDLVSLPRSRLVRSNSAFSKFAILGEYLPSKSRFRWSEPAGILARRLRHFGYGGLLIQRSTFAWIPQTATSSGEVEAKAKISVERVKSRQGVVVGFGETFLTG
jgi:hypothetical protein